jgi:hypothetical protein
VHHLGHPLDTRLSSCFLAHQLPRQAPSSEPSIPTASMFEMSGNSFTYVQEKGHSAIHRFLRQTTVRTGHCVNEEQATVCHVSPRDTRQFTMTRRETRTIARRGGSEYQLGESVRDWSRGLRSTVVPNRCGRALLARGATGRVTVAACCAAVSGDSILLQLQRAMPSLTVLPAALRIAGNDKI